MSILTKVEAKGWRGRLFLSGVTLILIIGGATMLYPFLLMVSGAMRSNMDASDMSLMPKYLKEDAELVRKFLETKYNYSPILMNRFHQARDYSFREAEINLDIRESEIADFKEFLNSRPIPDHWQVLGGTQLYQGMSSVTHRKLVRRLRDKFEDDLDAYNTEMGAPIRSWWVANLLMPSWTQARTVMKRNPLYETYFELMRESPVHERAFPNLTALFLERIAYPTYGMNTFENFRDAHGLDAESYETFSLPRRVPPPEQESFRREWLEFVFEDHLNMSFVRSDASDADYQAFLQDRFETLENLKQYWHDADYASFEDIRLPADHEWVPDFRRNVYKVFLQTLPPESLRLVGPEFAWRDFLRAKYETVEAAAAAHAADYTVWRDCRLPTAQVEVAGVLAQTGKLRRRYAGRNFRIVANQMFVQGRPFFNTIVYVCLALLFSLTLQPLAAYALSRFKPKGTWKIIFIFIATMAFPPMVGMIPQFLIIQKLGLLNTFIALVLPVTVNGMLIFLLKGFFDSIPKDLYDAAVIDGASEFRIFWQITMAMSTPILAVVALQTFSAAWMSFMYPLIVCPDEKMHVLAVWLQQFQQNAPGTAVFASIIIASFPSLLIFIFAQRTIMRGIAVPSEK